MHASVLSLFALVAVIRAHTAGFARGMYCLNGNDTSKPNLNSNAPVTPLYQLSQKDWWFHHDNGCDQVPPEDGDILELPAGGSFTLELAHNQAQTSLSYDCKYCSDWPDGKEHPEDWHGAEDGSEGCIQNDGALHTQNETAAAGTAMAISYESNLSAVTMENLAVFTVLEQYVLTSHDLTQTVDHI